MMTLQEFKASIQTNTPPTGISELALALWYDAKGNWEAAHTIAQSREGTKDYDLIHAYLHRVEGDNWNADYWYRRAKSTRPNLCLQEEWEGLVNYFL